MSKEKGLDGFALPRSRKLPGPLFLVFIFLTAAISVSGYVYYQKQKKAVVLEQTGQLQAIADLKAAEIRRWLGERLGDANLITRNQLLIDELAPLLVSRPAPGMESDVQNWMEALQQHYQYENVLLLDRQGQVLQAGSPRAAAISREGLDLLERARRNRVAMLSDLHANPRKPTIQIDIAAPLIADEQVLGFVILRIDPAKFLYPLIQSWPTPSPSAETLLVRREGDNVLFLNELRHRRGTAMKLRLPLTQLDLPAAMVVMGRTGVAAGKDYRGIAVWSVIKPIADTAWFIISKIDREEIERPVRRSALAIFVVALFLILGAALMILFLWQRQNARFRLSQLEAQQESEEKFKQVFETANVGKSITQLGGEIQVNKAFCDMLGYSQEELQKKKWQELTPPDEIEATQKMLEPLLDGRENSARFSKRYMHKNGSLVWGDVSVSIRRDPAGKPLHFITTVVDISERKRGEETIRKNEARLRAVLDATPFPIAMVDVQDYDIDFWSRSALTLFGHTAPTAAAWYELAYPDPEYRREVVERWKPFLEEAQRSGQTVNTGEYRVTCRDGSVRQCELYAAFLADRLIVTFNDITERKQAEERFKENHMLIRMAGEVAKTGGWSVNLEENRVYWSDEVAAIHEMPPGYSPLLEEGINFYAPEWRERIAKAVSDCSQKGIPFNEEMEIITAHGNRVWIQTIGEAVRNAKGIIYKVQGAFQDISERKQAEQELMKLSARNQAMLEAIPDIIMEVDTNKVYTWANHAGIEFFGADVIGREAAYYFEGEQQTYLQVQPVFNGKEEVVYIESWQRRRDGEKRLLAWWCRVLKEADGKVGGVLSSARDITEIRLAENEILRLNEELEQRVLQRTEQLQAANKELEAFSYSVSHDLRAPLRAIDGFSRIVLEEYAPKLDDEGRRLLGVVRTNTGKMAQLIDDLLAFSRLSRQHMAFTAVDLASLAESIFSELKSQEKERRIEFKVGALPAAHGDPSMLRQVLQNLLANAVKFTRTKPRAVIELSAKAGTAENTYMVRDNGVGFDMTYADKLFGVFQRLHSADEFEGTGVGLAIVQRIVLRHGGRVWAESKGGKGATFYFSLPAGQEEGSRVEGLGLREE